VQDEVEPWGERGAPRDVEEEEAPKFGNALHAGVFLEKDSSAAAVKSPIRRKEPLQRKKEMN